MTTDNETVNSDAYDPDEPPESTFVTDFIGTLVTNVQVSKANIDKVEQHIAESVTAYWEKSNREGPVWFLEAHGLSVARSDGKPFRQSDIIALTDKNGRWLSKKMVPDVMATAYRGFGVTVSPLRNGEANSALGRVFHFKATEIGAGRKYKKPISLYPVEIFPAGYTYDGEVQVVEITASEDGATPSAAPTIPQDAVIAILRNALAGKSPSEMFDAVLNDTQLKSVGKVFGVSLMEAATDESLTGVLVENGVLVLDEDGKFAVPA